MTLDTKRWIVGELSFLFLASLLLVAYNESQCKRIEEKEVAIVTAVNESCVECHQNDSPALVMEWEESRHAKVGIGCVECHTANEGEIDAWKHEGTYVSALVTPMDMFHLKQDDLDDRVKGVLTVGEFYEKTDDAKVIFT